MASIRKRGNSYLLVVSMGYDPEGHRRKPQQKRGVHDQQCVPAHIPPAHVQYPNTLATPSSMSRMGRP